METAITILIFGIVGLSAVVCVAALLFTSGSRSGGAAGGGSRPGEQSEAPVDEAWLEARALVSVRNARRRRQGEPESDPEVEADQILRSLERETR